MCRGNNGTNTIIKCGVFNTGLNPANIDIILPIPFSFSKGVGNALPIFLFHLNKPLYVSLKTFENKLTANKPFTYNLITNYIYLSGNERMRFKISNNEYLHEYIKEHSITFVNGDTQSLGLIGNIKSIMWNIDPTTDVKYNIKVNGQTLFIQDKSYHYFTRKTISDAGFPGGGCSVNDPSSPTHVIHDDTIAYYSFALKGYDKQNPLASTGSISSSSNKIEIVSDVTNNTPIKVYTRSYNIISISDNTFELKYQY